MSNLTYNPNVNIPYHSNQFNNYDSYETARNDFSRNDFQRNNIDNNYKNDFDNNNYRNDFDRNDNYRNNFENNYYNSSNISNNDMPRSLPQIDPRNEYSRNEYSRSELSRPMNNKKIGFKNKSKMISKVNEKYQNDSDIDKINNSKLNWSLIIKKICIFTALFLIMSSIKMDELVCKFIPYLSENQLICMTTKGIILSILIIIINLLL